MLHVDKVVYAVETYQDIFIYATDKSITIAAAYGHDLVEDAKQTFNDMKTILGVEAAKVVLRVTDVPERCRSAGEGGTGLGSWRLVEAGGDEVDVAVSEMGAGRVDKWSL